MMTTIPKEMLTKVATELVQRFSSHEWVNADRKYRRLMRTDDGWVLLRSSGKVSRPLAFAGEITRAMPEASAVEGLVVIIGCGITVMSR